MKLGKATFSQQSNRLKILNSKTCCSVLLVISILNFFYILPHPPAFADEADINCDIHKGVCSQSLGDLTVSLEITPRPVKAMQDLVFKVALSEQPSPQTPHIDLGMPGMKMGPNRVALKNTGPGVYEGRGVIVRCPSGRRTWFAAVTVPAAGEVKFVFDVLY